MLQQRIVTKGLKRYAHFFVFLLFSRGKKDLTDDLRIVD